MLEQKTEVLHRNLKPLKSNIKLANNLKPMDVQYSVLLAMTVLIFCSPVFGGTFKIQLTTASQYTAKVLNIDVEAFNKGSSTAHHSTLTLKVLDNTYTHEKTPDIVPGQSYMFSFLLPQEELNRGSYPVVAVCSFKDYQEYPFTALNVSTFTVGSECNSTLDAQLNPIVIHKKKTTNLRLYNPANTPIHAQLQLVLPDEFSAIEKNIAVKLAPHSNQILDFVVTNHSAFGGASYPFFALIQYTEDGCHHTLVKNDIIQVKKISFDNLFYPLRWYFMFAFAMLILMILIVAAVKNMYKKRIGRS